MRYTYQLEVTPMSKPVPPSRVVKDYFTTYPCVIVAYHYRRDQLNRAYQEALDSARKVNRIVGNRVTFDTLLGASEIGLNLVTRAEHNTENKTLSLWLNFPSDTPHIIYKAACP